MYTYAGENVGRALYVQDQGCSEKGEVTFIGYSESAKRWTFTTWGESQDIDVTDIDYRFVGDWTHIVVMIL